MSMVPCAAPALPAHEEDQNKAFVRERVTFAHGRIVEPFSVARRDCGTLFCRPEGLRDTHGLRYGLIVTCTRSSVCVGRQKSALMNWISDQYGLYFL